MKAKATELQINDWVNYNNTACKVYCIESPFERRNEKFNNKYLVTLWCNGFIDAVEEEITPIPITDDILKANRFIKNVHTDEWWHYSNYPMSDFQLQSYYDSDGVLHPMLDINDYNYPITYIHELQHALRLCGLDELADNFKVV